MNQQKNWPCFHVAQNGGIEWVWLQDPKIYEIESRGLDEGMNPQHETLTSVRG